MPSRSSRGHQSLDKQFGKAKSFFFFELFIEVRNLEQEHQSCGLMQIKKKKKKDLYFALFNKLLYQWCTVLGARERAMGKHDPYCIYNYWFQNLATLTKGKAELDRIS